MLKGSMSKSTVIGHGLDSIMDFNSWTAVSIARAQRPCKNYSSALAKL